MTPIRSHPMNVYDCIFSGPRKRRCLNGSNRLNHRCRHGAFDMAMAGRDSDWFPSLGARYIRNGHLQDHRLSGWWWLEPWNFMTFHLLGMSSFQLRNYIFQRGRLNHQPDFMDFWWYFTRIQLWWRWWLDDWWSWRFKTSFINAATAVNGWMVGCWLLGL